MKRLFIATILIISTSSTMASSDVESFAKDFAANSLSHVTNSTVTDNGETKVNVTVAGVQCEVTVTKQAPNVTYPQRFLVSKYYCKPTDQGKTNHVKQSNLENHQ